MKNTSTVVKVGGKGDVIVSTRFFPNEFLIDYMFVDRIHTLMAEKAVKEIWKKHGASIIKKADKKTIGNLTIKRLTALIEKELKE